MCIRDSSCAPHYPDGPGVLCMQRQKLSRGERGKDMHVVQQLRHGKRRQDGQAHADGDDGHSEDRLPDGPD
eukprot:15453474-Alexandrium_andersonii.AAC.1